MTASPKHQAARPRHKLTRAEALRVKLLRLGNWEYWPSWALYTPIVFYGLLQMLRGRALDFAASNPSLPLGGMMGDHKYIPLKALEERLPAFVPDATLLDAAMGVEKSLEMLTLWMQKQGHGYPLVLKPDTGCRGQDVAIIRSEEQAVAYLSSNPVPLVAQAYVSGVEFGIFYMNDSRSPDTPGFIYSLAEKTFPHIVGDGVTPLRALLLRDKHARYTAAHLLHLHQDQLDRVLTAGEKFQIVELGTHSKGSIFVDKNHLITPELTAAAHKAAQAIGGYHVGRFDVRAPSVEAFQAGDFKILEANGVTAEAAHLYSPGTSLSRAWKILLRQWQLAYAIGHENKKQGHAKVTLQEVMSALFSK